MKQCCQCRSLQFVACVRFLSCMEASRAFLGFRESGIGSTQKKDKTSLHFVGCEEEGKERVFYCFNTVLFDPDDERD